MKQRPGLQFQQVSKDSALRVTTPPVYRPQPTAQPKAAVQRSAPPVYSPCSTPKGTAAVLQPMGKFPAAQVLARSMHNAAGKTVGMGAPPVYRPHNAAQAKPAPPVYAPYAVGFTKTPSISGLSSGRMSLQPTVAQARALTGVIQMKCGRCGESGHTTKNCKNADYDDLPVEEKKVEAKKPEAIKIPKRIPEELSFGAPVVPVVRVRPAPGATLTDLRNMADLKDVYPSTFAQTLVAVGGYTVENKGLLTYGRGTEKETHEWKVKRGNLFFVIHYHPRAPIPTGPLSGESKVHVKGSRSAKHHEAMADAFYTTLGLTLT